VSWQTDIPEILTIAQVREIAGVSARTLRYYEELDLLPGVRRRAGGRRVYGPDEIERLRFIQRLKTLGLSLAEIKELNAVYRIQGSTQAMLSHLEKLLDDQLAVVDGRISELVALRDDIQKYGDHVVSRLRGADSAPPAELRVVEGRQPDPDSHPELEPDRHSNGNANVRERAQGEEA
jgi:DNA-binding transcriptional MerR regulator